MFSPAVGVSYAVASCVVQPTRQLTGEHASAPMHARAAGCSRRAGDGGNGVGGPRAGGEVSGESVNLGAMSEVPMLLSAAAVGCCESLIPGTATSGGGGTAGGVAASGDVCEGQENRLMKMDLLLLR